MKKTLLLLPLAAAAACAEPYTIRIVDKANGWPVPGVELRTTHHLRLVSDNAGVIACDIPELMGKETWFTVIGHGYGIPKDGFGYSGVRLTPKPGETRTVQVTRTNLAKRLGRLTGAGLFVEGTPGAGPETGVFGCDTVMVAPYRGELFWLWGDTTLPHYPLGLFDTLGATTPLSPLTAFEPPLRLPYTHFRDDRTGRPRNIAKLPGKGPTWLTGLVTLTDASGRERLGAVYTKITPPLETYETGLCLWNDDTQNFEVLKTLWRKGDEAPKPVMPDWHPTRVTEAGATRILFCNPLPTLSCPDSFEAWQDPAQWKVHKPQAKIPTRDGKEVTPHDGSMIWSAHRKKWAIVFMEKFGKPSAFGEVWYAESDSPYEGWGRAVKILTHDNYTFYNLLVHPELTPPDADFILFEGTYTIQFADRPAPTPRWDYNQVLYRLDFKDVE